MPTVSVSTASAAGVHQKSTPKKEAVMALLTGCRHRAHRVVAELDAGQVPRRPAAAEVATMTRLPSVT